MFKKVPFICLSIFWILCLLSLFTSCEKQTTIRQGLSEAQANEILVFLAQKNIKAHKIVSLDSGGMGGEKVTLWDVIVNPEDEVQALYLLHESGLPSTDPLNAILEACKTSGLIPSEMQEKIKQQQILQAQISSAIRKFDGILDAVVILSYPEEEPLVKPQDRKGKITASVVVRHSGVLDDPNLNLTSRIKRIVAGSVTGLEYENITIVPHKASIYDTTSAVFGGEKKVLVSIWSVVIAKDSIPRFRLIFFSFTIIILLLLALLALLIWRILPLLRPHGGINALFHMSQITKKQQQKESQNKEPPKPEDKGKSST